MKKLFYGVSITTAFIFSQTTICADAKRRATDLEKAMQRDFADQLGDPEVIQKRIDTKQAQEKLALEKRTKKAYQDALEKEQENFLKTADGERRLKEAAQRRITTDLGIEGDNDDKKALDEGRRQASVERYRKKHGPGIIEKIPGALTDGALGAVSSLTREVGVTLGFWAFNQSKKALTAKSKSPEEIKQEEDEAKYNAEFDRLTKEVERDSKRIEFIKLALAVDQYKELTAHWEEKYEEAKRKKAKAEEADIALKAAIHEQQAPVPVAPAA